MSLIDRIQDKLFWEDMEREGQSTHLANLYAQADEKGKQLLDEAIACLCGYSLKALIF